MKSALKWLAAQVNVQMYQRLTSYAILKGPFHELMRTPKFANRELLWSDCIETRIGRDVEITYVEFGVYKGDSIRHISGLNRNPGSIFIGLDSFEGLPDSWGALPKGSYSAQDKIPNIADSRVSFIKGWFQDTWDKLDSQIQSRSNLVVHYDADIYSSTLFALSKIDGLHQEYFAIFDEFTGHETRALYDYIQGFGASVAFLGFVPHQQYPMQALCRITPHGV
jgi:O-methyltransferase